MTQGSIFKSITDWFHPSSRNLTVALFLFASVLLTFSLTFWRLGIPPKSQFDEIYYVPAARDLLQNKADPNSVHPPLAKFLIAVSLAFFGDNPTTWRIPSVLACVMTVSFLFLLALELFGSPQLAFLTALFCLMDGFTFVHARIGMLDMMMVGFLMPAIYFFTKKRYLLSGIFLGLSLACKWTGIFSFPFFALLIWNDSGDWKTWRQLLLLVILPSILIYFVLFRLLAVEGTPPGKHFSFAGEVSHAKWIKKRHLSSLKFHFRSTMIHTYSTRWWKAILLIRPTWYYYLEANGIVHGVIALPNPFFWWPSLLAALLLIFKLSDPKARFIFFGSVVFACFWSISTKGVFIFYFLPACPFLALALMYWVRNSKILLASTFATVLTGFILFFPIYACWPITRAHFDKLMWLKTWI